MFWETYILPWGTRLWGFDAQIMGNQLKTLMSTPDIVCYTKDFIIIEAD